MDLDLVDIAPDLDKWIDDNCIVTKEDRVEATLDGEAMYSHVVEDKLIELTVKRHELLALLDECYKRFKQYDMDNYEPDMTPYVHTEFMKKLEATLGR
ncbi:hypothetical protein NX722_03080 [Endozoicomonas gorgoniicola]|uniref:Uncharacterized protein n=1 Tax=Endozoicomonas gorgoniicola TaxID=1234144 RepID=A0ABT3MQJ3_9GAMM|nr:hypothetical protein [Endozoicomonas gorgoniicola]MCW7551644.1 hypothetical protein [Endozoicomonas gorgoniicola]